MNVPIMTDSHLCYLSFMTVRLTIQVNVVTSPVHLRRLL